MQKYIGDDRDYNERMKHYLAMKRKGRETKANEPVMQEKEVLSFAKPVHKEEFSHPENIDEQIKERGRKKKWVTWVVGLVILIVVVAGLWYVLK